MRLMIARPWIVLLAAGGSLRLGRPKQLLRIRGEAMLRRAARIALAAKPSGCVVVLGAHAGRLRKELAGLPVQVVANRAWRTGLASSLRAGISALPSDAGGALVLLADQIAVGPADLELLISAWRRVPAKIITAAAGGVRQPPAIFPRLAFGKLLRLRGDQGARIVLRDPATPVVEFELPGAHVDVDRPAHVARLKRVRHRA